MRSVVLAVFVLAVLALGAEALAYAHDTWVVAQDDACADAALAKIGKTRDGEWSVSDVPECHFVDKKKFGPVSQRTWVTSLPGGLGVFEQIELMGRALLPTLPFLVLCLLVLWPGHKTTSRRVWLATAGLTAVAGIAFFVVRQLTLSTALFDMPLEQRLAHVQLWTRVVIGLFFAVLAGVVALGVGVLRREHESRGQRS